MELSGSPAMVHSPSVGQPWLHVALLVIPRLARVGDIDLEGAAGSDRLRGLDVNVGEASCDGLRRHTIDADFVGMQDEVEIERIELLGGPGADDRRTRQGLGSGDPS